MAGNMSIPRHFCWLKYISLGSCRNELFYELDIDNIGISNTYEINLMIV